MAVEAPEEHVCLIRVAGNLDRSAAAGLLRLIDAQMALVAAGRRRVSDLIVDLEGVGSFEPGGLEATRHARHATAGRGVRIHLVGCSHRFHLLPLRARQILGDFRTFPTVEVALAELAGPTDTRASTTPARADRDGGTDALPAPRRHSAACAITHAMASGCPSGTAGDVVVADFGRSTSSRGRSVVSSTVNGAIGGKS